MDILPTTLHVQLYGRLVGTITRIPGDTIGFSFTQAYIDDESRPTLSYGYFDSFKRLRTKMDTAVGRMPAFFSNLLPEGDLQRYIAHHSGVSRNDEFALLWVTGHDLPGAAKVIDPEGRAYPPPREGGPDFAPNDEQLLRFSLAGVQLKFSAIEKAGGGLTIPVHGEDGDWVAKLPSVRTDLVPENEFAMLSFAKSLGIEVPEIKLINVADISGLPEEATGLKGHALASRRFDRPNKHHRTHIEDFNQVFRRPPGDKYSSRSFADICKTLYHTIGNDAVREFVRRLVFNIGIGNADMHLKNWSLIYRDARTPALSPAYDYLSTRAHVTDNDIGLTLGTTRAFPQVNLSQMEAMADRAGVSRGIVKTAALAMVSQMRDAWPQRRSSMPFEQLATTIDVQFEKVPLFAES